MKSQPEIVARDLSPEQLKQLKKALEPMGFTLEQNSTVIRGGVSISEHIFVNQSMPKKEAKNGNIS